MCITSTPVLYFLFTVIIEVYSQCFTKSAGHRDIEKSTSRAEISSPSSLYFKAVKRALSGSASTVATNELTNSNHIKNSHRTPLFSLEKET